MATTTGAMAGAMASKGKQPAETAHDVAVRKNYEMLARRAAEAAG